MATEGDSGPKDMVEEVPEIKNTFKLDVLAGELSEEPSPEKAFE